MAYSVRRAVLDDIPSILEELKSFSDFYGSKIPLYRDDSISEGIIKSFIEKHVFYVAVTNDDEVIGFISGLLLPHIYNPDIETLVESFWWVNEDYRRSKAGIQLLEKFIEHGKKEVDWIICTIEDFSPVNEDVFLKRGFRLKEKSYLMEVN